MMEKSDASAWGKWATIGLIVLVGLNLRPFLTAPGPILSLIQKDTGLGNSAAAMLTLLPMLLMGLGAFVSPAVQSMIGTRRGVLVALVVLALGSALRAIAPNGVSLIMATALCGGGVAFIQAVFPGIIKARFPDATAPVTGLYSAMIMGGGAAGAWATPKLVDAGCAWRTALAAMGLPTLIALLAAFVVLSNVRLSRPDPALAGRLLRRPRTWTLMVAFGLVNGGYASLVAWLAPFYQSMGWSAAASGSLVATMAIAQAGGALAVPFLARKSTDRRPWLFATLVMQGIGFAGLAFAPMTSPFLWVAVCGTGLAGSFALAIVTALDHLPLPGQAGTLAALMQGGGFLIAAFAPYEMALLIEWSGGYANGWIMHLIFVTITFALYMRFDPTRYDEAMNVANPILQPDL
jgi:CP family cyanate transporter-like MFS transporter